MGQWEATETFLGVIYGPDKKGLYHVHPLSEVCLDDAKNEESCLAPNLNGHRRIVLE